MHAAPKCVTHGQHDFFYVLLPMILGTLRSATATSTRTSPQNITLPYDKSFAVILSRSLLTVWAKYPNNKLVRAVTK